MNWILKKVEVSKLKEWHKNPRQLTKKGIEDLTKSIKKFGIAEPLVCNSDLTICGGHGRLKVIKELGISEVDIYLPEKQLTDKQFEELNIRLNKNIAGTWDFDILANEFETDELIEWGFEKYELGMFDEVEFPEIADGDREPFQQMTFTLADQQAQIIQQCLKDARSKEDFNYCETYQNENSNGNALYFIVSQWLTLNK